MTILPADCRQDWHMNKQPHTNTNTQSVSLLTFSINYAFSHWSITSDTHKQAHTPFNHALTTHRRSFWGVPSSVCRCCCHGNNRWNSRGESRVDCRFTLCPWHQALASSGALESSVSQEPVKWDSALHMQHAAFLPSLTSTGSQLPYPRTLHLKLESSCPWIIISWDRFLEYPGQNYPKGQSREEEWSCEPFWAVGVRKCLFWTVSVSWQWPGSHEGLLVCAAIWICQREGTVLDLLSQSTFFRVKVRVRVWFKSGIRG